MTKQPKFRVWDKATKAMNNQPEVPYDWNLNNVFEDQPDLEFMQSTELKDKNGKELFFDDIVKLKGCDNNFEVREDDFGIPVFVANDRVGNTKELMSIDFKEFFLEGNFARDDFEIIGNIYSDPDLLNNLNQTND